MNEYISREAVEQVLCGIENGLSVGETEALKTKDVKALYKIKGAKEILNAVDNDLCFIPAADVQPVKHGRWEEITDYERDKMLRDTVAELCEAKRLLKAAVEALNDGSCNKDCRQCENHKSCDYDNRFKWKHTNEVLKLIGEGGDEECQ